MRQAAGKANPRRRRRRTPVAGLARNGTDNWQNDPYRLLTYDVRTGRPEGAPTKHAVRTVRHEYGLESIIRLPRRYTRSSDISRRKISRLKK